MIAVSPDFKALWLLVIDSLGATVSCSKESSSIIVSPA